MGWTLKMKLEIGPEELNRCYIFKKLLNHVVSQNRFVLDSELQNEINQIIGFIKTNCACTLEEGDKLYRARIHDRIFEQYKCFPNEEMIGPPPEKAKDGRLNPKGIVYLYTALEEETCVYENRPWIGAELTVVRFVLRKKINIIDVTECFEVPNGQTDLFFAWITEIKKLFSKPVYLDDSLEYLPTQYISETIKSLNFDGIKYRSSINENGNNLALFSNNVVDIEYKYKIKINKIKYEFEESIYAPDP